MQAAPGAGPAQQMLSAAVAASLLPLLLSSSEVGAVATALSEEAMEEEADRRGPGGWTAEPGVTPVNLTNYPLLSVDKDAKCIGGTDPGVQVWVNPKPTTQWVITLGSVSPGLGSWMCTSEATCAQFAKPPTTPAPPPTPVGPWVPAGGTASAPGLAEGMQSQNCTVNPLFCTANQVVIAACDFSLFLGSGTVDAVYVEKNASDPSDPGHNVTVKVQFNGRKILAASLKRLAPLGLSKATDVILCGVTFGGTALILNADYIGTQLKALAPKLTRYKAVAVDGNHPQYGTGLAMSRNVHQDPAKPSEDSWLTSAFKFVSEFSNVKTNLPVGCVAAHPGHPELCLYTDKSLAYVKTPIFVVQQMPCVQRVSIPDLDDVDINMSVHV
jgi:hypothetical protein